MYKIAILGTENTHAWGFASLLKEGLYPDIELVGYYGDEQGNTAIKTKTGFDCVMNDYNDLVGKVDAVMVTARHGANHLKYARSYIESGIPVWIDKPITCSIKDTREFVDLCTKYHNPVCGGSMLGLVEDTLSLRRSFEECGGNISGGAVFAPVNMVNLYGNFWFYATHLVQVMLSVFGNDVKSVSALKSPKGVSAVYRYDNFDVTALYGAEYNYACVLYGKQMVYREIDLSDGTRREMNEFSELLHTGKARQTFEELTRPVFVIDATNKAFDSGKLTEIESL